MIVDVKPDDQGHEGRNVTMAAVLVVLDEQQREQVQRLARAASTAARTVLRARIVLAAAAGQANAAIARDLRIGVDTVRKWRRRFARLGLAGRTDLPRGGRPRRYDAADRLRIAALATSVPPHPESTWSHTRIAEQMAQRYDTPISASHVGRILTGTDLRPHRVRGWLTRKDDPLFWDRAADVCQLYLHPPAGAVVLSIDEKTAIAARSRKHPAQPCTPGRPVRQEFEYVRHGTVSIIAALDVRTGQVMAEPISRNDSATFQAFLSTLDQSIDPRKQIHIVLDNGSSHVAKATRAWLSAHPRWHVHWTPVHASWLNQIELYFSAVARRVIRHGDFTSRTDLIDKIETYVIDKNTTAKPYRWTYDGTHSRPHDPQRTNAVLY